MSGYFYIGFIDFMLARKKLTDYTSLFSPHDFKKNGVFDKRIFSEQTKFRLSEIIGIENYFYQEINQRKSAVKN